MKSRLIGSWSSAMLVGVAATACGNEPSTVGTVQSQVRIYDGTTCDVELSKVDVDDGTGNTRIELIVDVNGSPGWNQCGIDNIQYLDAGCQPRGGVMPATAPTDGRLVVNLGAWSGYSGLHFQGGANYDVAFAGYCASIDEITLLAEATNQVNVLNCGAIPVLEAATLGAPAALVPP